MSVKEVTRWQTSDGNEHSSREWAEKWEANLEAAEMATKMLESGSSVADCLRAISYPAEIAPILERVTKDTQLVISHWQGQRSPGYKPTRFCADGQVVAYGHAGSWTGPYGGKISILDLVRYAGDERSVLNT